MTEFNKHQIDAIVVGAGPAGVSAALSLTRAGKKVVVLERGDFAGSKNMFGGAVYLKSLKELLPESYVKAPFERFLTSHTYSFLTDSGATDIKTSRYHCVSGEFEGVEEYNEELLKKASAATVLRPVFDKWLVKQAKKEGVYVATRTLAKKLIFKNGAVVGVQTGQEKFYAPVTILCDGVNSLLAREARLRKEFYPENMLLTVKETYKGDKDLITERFNLKKGSLEGACIEFLGGLSGFYEKYLSDKKKEKELVTPFAIGFLYTFKGQISLGLGVSLSDLVNYKIKPYDLLDKLKENPSVRRLLEGFEAQEYSAHMIPEGGFKNLPKLYGNGVLVAGDAAGLVNGVHFEGTNFAIESGKLAGEAAASALSAGNVSKSALKIYEDKMAESFVLKDLKAYRNVIDHVYSRKDSILNYYPRKMAEFMGIMTTADNLPKKKKFWKFILSIFRDRSIVLLVRDFRAILAIIFEILF